jgi:hypothetical protein
MASSTASMLIEESIAFDSRQATTQRASQSITAAEAHPHCPRAALDYLTRGSTFAFAGYPNQSLADLIADHSLLHQANMQVIGRRRIRARTKTIVNHPHVSTD